MPLGGTAGGERRGVQRCTPEAVAVAGLQPLPRNRHREFQHTVCHVEGGVSSPLPANVALHGLETAIRAAFPSRTKEHPSDWKPKVVRYADDFVIMHDDLAVIERVQQITNAWLAGMGLELKPSKTRITHSLRPHDGNVRFDFLGFQVRQFPVGKTHSGTLATRTRGPQLLGFKTIISPSTEALRRHFRSMAQIVEGHKMAPQGALIARLNPVIRGWANYYATACSKDAFAKVDHLLFTKLRSWARFRHPHKSRLWIANKYWHRNRGSWDFASKDGKRLANHDRIPIRRHTKVQDTRSPYDGDWIYWSRRLGAHPTTPRRIAFLLKQQ